MTGIAALLAGLGVVGIGFGILAALMSVIQPAGNSPWIFANLLIGFVLLGSAVVMSLDSLRERIRSGGSKRAGKLGSSSITNAILSIVILGFLGFLSAKYTTRIDVSEAGVHTMSPQTTELLASLEQEISITAFFKESEAPPIRDLLDRYAYASEKIDLQFVDPNDRPALVEEFGVSANELARGVVRVSLDSGDSISLTQFTEPAVTNALRRLAMSTGKKVYFLTGHNERQIDPDPGSESAFATGPEEFGRAADALRNETYEVESILLANQADVPADASAVVIAGPTRPLLAGELAALQRYLEGGGALFVAIDPRSQTNLYDLLRTWGVSLGNDVIVDRALAVFGQATTPIAGEYDGRHPITSKLREPTLFPQVRSVEIDAEAGSDFSILAKTGPESWAERDLDEWRDSGRAELGPNDLVGPVPIAVAGIPRLEGIGKTDTAGAATTGRLVVFGDSNFATNEFIDALRNRDLFVNSVNWLVGDVEQITVRPNVSRASSFRMTQSQSLLVQYLSLFVLPEAIAIFGVVTWWLRRKAPGRFAAKTG